MRVFVYEYLTAHGIGRDPASPEHGMYREGRAMRDALVWDLERGGVTSGGNFEGTLTTGCGVLPFCDWTIIIAPETDGLLAEHAQFVLRRRGRLLGPSPEAIRLTSDKLALAEHWREHGIPTPATSDREPTACEAFPVVWKPRDGAGSAATFRLNSAFDVTSANAQLVAEKNTSPMILQEYVPGQAASIAFLCGPAGNVPLLPTFQHLSDDGRFKYRGGELPIPPALAERAVKLGQRAVDCVPGLLGYIGVDLVLGDAEDGSRDFAIEINPRITTSYVGLRQLAQFNIAEAMLRAAHGQRLEPFCWKSGRIRFASDGTTTLSDM